MPFISSMVVNDRHVVVVRMPCFMGRITLRNYCLWVLAWACSVIYGIKKFSFMFLLCCV